ncbi:cation:proton antiporter [Leptolyngbya sp. FACHB-711]|uniref:cation:proton antiporter domain-containing protein n=1 Tax=Leptolyngbya sp. FACHB-711 TaxID=2692813 RepID=UPI001682F54B|nr:cation:proton antiporter [Leptolyngbya sp. FACHB-711]MBD1853868.1 cation:proton antiporter [Cyanobacteria bacterium FACHB-502]MBD2024304.1 cation:proton antiporter [Leptolyngbya sp. FACHB-711]
MQLEPIVSFALLLAVILIVPIAFERIRLPGLLGLLIAGVILGPNALRLLSNESETMHLLSDIGLVYLLFVAGLEIDLEQFRATKHRSAGFGFLTFLFPLLTGIAVGRVFGFGWNSSVLIGSLLASHTLLAYPIVSRLGLVNNEAVTVTIGATIFTDIGALLVLAICVGINKGDFSVFSLASLLLSLLIYSAVILFGFNWLGKEFFRRSGDAEGNQFLFVLLVVFIASISAELIGIEKIVGAFLAGLAVNTAVGEGSVKEKILFVGSVLFIPIFFVNTGLIINIPGFIRSLGNIELTLAIVLGLIGSKFLAALGTKFLFGYGWREMITMWSLSLPQVAATLAAAFVGFRANIISEDVLNTVIVMFVVTATLGPIITARAASGLTPSTNLPEALAIDSFSDAPEAHRPLTIVVPIYNPQTQRNLLEMAALFARHEAGRIVPLSIASGHVHMDSPQVDSDIQQGEAFLRQATETCQSLGANATPVLRIDDETAQGISRASREQNANLIAMGWGRTQGIRARLFGNVIDRVLWASHCPVAIMRLLDSPSNFRRILVPIDNPTRESIQLLLFADILEDANNASITLLHVCDRYSPPEREAWIESQLRMLVAKYVPFVYPNIQIVRSGDIAGAIIEASRAHDLVVMRNSRRRDRAAGELILSDITNRALRHIPCSVVMIGEPHGHKGLMMMRRARPVQEVGGSIT